jgi:hypothetical protein
LIPTGNVAQSAIEQLIHWRAFILNVRSIEPSLWNQEARGRQYCQRALKTSQRGALENQPF